MEPILIHLGTIIKLKNVDSTIKSQIPKHSLVNIHQPLSYQRYYTHSAAAGAVCKYNTVVS